MCKANSKPPKDKYADDAKSLCTKAAMPNRKVGVVACMPCDSCGELKYLFSEGLIGPNTRFMFYEIGSEHCSFDGMVEAVTRLLRGWGLSSEDIAKRCRFYNSEMLGNVCWDAKAIGWKIDFLYADLTCSGNEDILDLILDNFFAGQFTLSAEISINALWHRGMNETRRKRWRRLARLSFSYGGHYRGPSRDADTQDMYKSIMVALMCVLPFPVELCDTVNYARGMNVNRYQRTTAGVDTSEGRTIVDRLLEYRREALLKAAKQYKKTAKQKAKQLCFA